MGKITNFGTTGVTSIEWFTPRKIVEALGPFDLDPCTSDLRPFDTAKTHYTRADDGLVKPWLGRVWLNPPYGRTPGIGPWLARLADHGDGIALVAARLETRAFQEYVWKRADALLFLSFRPSFLRAKGEPQLYLHGSIGGSSVLIAYGAHNHNMLAVSGLPGTLVDAWVVAS